MAATQLSLYNGALRKLKERKLASLSENREARRLLDDAWDGLIDRCLEAAMWRFARRTVKLLYDAGYTADFGHQYRFLKPEDFVRTIGLWHDEGLSSPNLDYFEEGGYYYSNVEEVYLAYVSNGVDYGKDYTLWPKSFEEYVEYELAAEIVGRLSQDNNDVGLIASAAQRALLAAKANSAMEGPSKMVPAGRWASSRRGDNANRGSRGRLIG